MPECTTYYWNKYVNIEWNTRHKVGEPQIRPCGAVRSIQICIMIIGYRLEAEVKRTRRKGIAKHFYKLHIVRTQHKLIRHPKSHRSVFSRALAHLCVRKAKRGVIAYPKCRFLWHAGDGR